MSAFRSNSYEDLLSDEDKSWEAEHELILKKEFLDARAARERDDKSAELLHLESAFAEMKQMKARLVPHPLFCPGSKYEPFNNIYAAKELCRLYMQEGRHDDAINFASECYFGAHDAFFRWPVMTWQVYSENFGKLLIFKFWGEALGNFYVATDQEYMARHLWETILNDLKMVKWDTDQYLEKEQRIWRDKISRLKHEDEE